MVHALKYIYMLGAASKLKTGQTSESVRTSAEPPPPSRLRTPLVEKNIVAYLRSTGFETQLVYAGHMQWHG